jgi:GNAT superfamily N-acetyltransferase
MNDTIDAAATLAIVDWRPDGEDAATLAADLEALAEMLHLAVHGGAGVSFVLPFTPADARRFWSERVRPAVAAGSKRVLVARLDGRIVGTVQLDFPWPPNQPHRADVGKLLVHPSARRRGVARALMLAIEAVARAEGRSLLTLDCVTGAHAEALYRSIGYVAIGVIPGFALASRTSEPEDTTFMYKPLGGAPAPTAAA